MCSQAGDLVLRESGSRQKRKNDNSLNTDWLPFFFLLFLKSICTFQKFETAQLLKSFYIEYISYSYVVCRIFRII